MGHGLCKQKKGLALTTMSMSMAAMMMNTKSPLRRGHGGGKLLHLGNLTDGRTSKIITVRMSILGAAVRGGLVRGAPNSRANASLSILHLQS